MTVRWEVVDEVLQPALVAMDPRSDSLPSGVSHSIVVRCSECWPLVPVEDPGPKEDLCDGLNSTCPGRGTSLTPYLGAVVMPKCTNRAWSLPVGIGASSLKDSTLSASLYIFSTSMSVRGEYSSSSLSLLVALL
jgi:hypothetical protein